MAGQIELAPWQIFPLLLYYRHFCLYAGVGAGKSTTGSHFAIEMMRKHPELLGLIGANDYNQLSQATLSEFFKWLEHYGFEYVIDQRPPASWKKTKRRFKSYENVMTVRHPEGHVSQILTRVLSNFRSLAGITLSWYWLDESRDTKEDAHNVILARLRESKEIAHGLITTTTYGEDWTYQRYVKGNDGSRMYGSAHVPTIEAVKLGILTPQFYQTLLKSYSPLLAAQELNAEHVNVTGGRAYYAQSSRNKRSVAPWGDRVPNPERDLIVGMDFNFQPAPCVWMIGQLGPYGTEFEESIHWFRHLAFVEVSSAQMAERLVAAFPGFFYRCFGDASGGRGTTSNAGATDYAQIGEALTAAGAYGYSIDYDQANPLVKDRVENMNRLFCDATGAVRQTYDPQGCPLFDEDCKNVGWKRTLHGQKLDDKGKDDRTHASDGAGYAVFKLLPPPILTRGRAISIPSPVRPQF